MASIGLFPPASSVPSACGVTSVVGSTLSNTHLVRPSSRVAFASSSKSLAIRHLLK